MALNTCGVALITIQLVCISPAASAQTLGRARFLVSGKLKVLAHLENWFREFRRYHRDDKGTGKIVKRDDPLMDAAGYLVVSGREIMRGPPKTILPVPEAVPVW